MDLIECGMENIRGGEECPCICSRATGGFRASDTRALEKNICGCSCSIDCSFYPVVDNTVANADWADSYN